VLSAVATAKTQEICGFPGIIPHRVCPETANPGQGVSSNLVLSQRRADAVMEYLISQGVKSDMVAAHGYGDARPVASNKTDQARAQNRRVELTLAGSGG